VDLQEVRLSAALRRFLECGDFGRFGRFSGKIVTLRFSGVLRICIREKVCKFVEMLISRGNWVVSQILAFPIEQFFNCHKIREVFMTNRVFISYRRIGGEAMAYLLKPPESICNVENPLVKLINEILNMSLVK